MLEHIKEKKYIFIKNFLSEGELNILQPYCLRKTCSYDSLLNMDTQSPFAPSFYKDEIMDSLLLTKKTKAEEISGLQLLETYTYWRGYIHGSILEDHTDRPSCEISITANIDSCGNKWPIHMNGNWIDMDIGDAVMYLGCEVNHGRKPFQGKYCAQVFFHYVDANGIYKIFKKDKN